MARRMRGYVPQRQRLSLKAESISSLEGCGFLSNKATAVRILPGWQYPHCETDSSSQACWTWCSVSFARPSIVVMLLSPTDDIGVMQERTASPSISTVHEAQNPTPHPNFVPVILRRSRSTHNRGMFASASTVRTSSLMVSVQFTKEVLQ